jgi:hypothetical protein
METLDEGATSWIKRSEHVGYVIKCYKRAWTHKGLSEKTIHARISDILEKTQSPLRTPKLFNPCDAYYVMEEINTDRPLWHEDVWASLDKKLQGSFLIIVWSAFKHLWEEKYDMRDVEVYLQPDNTLVVLDFDQVKYAENSSQTFGIHSAAVVPPI